MILILDKMCSSDRFDAGGRLYHIGLRYTIAFVLGDCMSTPVPNETTYSGRKVGSFTLWRYGLVDCAKAAEQLLDKGIGLESDLYRVFVLHITLWKVFPAYDYTILFI